MIEMLIKIAELIISIALGAVGVSYVDEAESEVEARLMQSVTPVVSPWLGVGTADLAISADCTAATLPTVTVTIAGRSGV